MRQGQREGLKSSPGKKTLSVRGAAVSSYGEEEGTLMAGEQGTS